MAKVFRGEQLEVGAIFTLTYSGVTQYYKVTDVGDIVKAAMINPETHEQYPGDGFDFPLDLSDVSDEHVFIAFWTGCLPNKQDVNRWYYNAFRQTS